MDRLPPSGRTILFVAPRFHTNQIGMIRALLSQGHKVEFHSLLKGETEDYSLLSPVTIPEASVSKLLRRLLGDGGVNRPRAFPELISYFRRLRALRPDVVIARDPSRAFSLVAAAIGRLLNARVVFYSQDFLHRPYSLTRRAATWMLLKWFSASWYTPLRGPTGTAAAIPRGRYFIPFVVDAGERDESASREINILTVGKYNPRKNHLLLVDALAPIMAERNVRAVIVGECVSDAQHQLRAKVAARIRELGLGDRITLMGTVPHSHMPALYKGSDLFVLPASEEPAAISVLEAIAFNVPAICSDSCGTRFYIEEGRTGDVFRSDSVEDLERVLRHWLSDEDRLRSASEACRRSAVAFSGAVFYRQFKEMLLDRWPAERGRW